MQDDVSQRAEQLTAEAIELCDKLGHWQAAAYLQLGLDMMAAKAPGRLVLREERSPWNMSEEPQLP